jgi:hypothetical protein
MRTVLAVLLVVFSGQLLAQGYTSSVIPYVVQTSDQRALNLKQKANLGLAKASDSARLVPFSESPTSLCALVMAFADGPNPFPRSPRAVKGVGNVIDQETFHE